MEIRQLRYFIAVADTLSFSRASEVLYLSQSALSRQISDLEKELGLPLFVRSTRQVELTEAGTALVPAAKDLISRWEKLSPELQNKVAPQHQAITLSVGADRRALTDPERRIRVMELLHSLRDKFPGILILLRVRDYQDLIQGLLTHTVDCALALDRELELRTEIESEVMGAEEMVLVFRSDERHEPMDFAEILMTRGLIMIDRESQGLHHIIRILNDLRLEPHIRFCESFHDMTMTAETGECAMIIPESVARSLNNPHLRVLPLPSELARLQMVFLYGRNRDNPAVREFRERLRGAL